MLPNEKCLCRAKRVDNEKWVEGYYIHNPFHDEGYQDGICVPPATPYGSAMTYAVIPETIGWYTGKDLNGEKLFTNDIIESYEDYDDKFGYPTTNEFKSVVIWDEENFCYALDTDGYIQPFNDWDWDNSKKIGNVHDSFERK